VSTGKNELSGRVAGSPGFIDYVAELSELSRYLHDTISQELVSLAFTISFLESMPLPEPARVEVASAQRMIDQCCREVRLISAVLAPPALADNSLPSAIEQLAEFVTHETGIRITCDLEPVPALSGASQILLAIAVQSWLALPIRRRLQPAVTIQLRNHPQEVALQLLMCPSPAGAAEGWSLLRERARALGGTFSVTAEPGSVRARLSLPEREALTEDAGA
jgi:signal transduction histidine kinase